MKAGKWCTVFVAPLSRLFSIHEKNTYFLHRSLVCPEFAGTRHHVVEPHQRYQRQDKDA
jgi:hypothetical protein